MQRVFVILSLTLLAGGASPAPSASAQSSRTVLRVALFPYVPDASRDRYAGLQAFIEQEFERRHPTIDLHLRPLNQADNFYGVDQVSSWLAASPVGPAYDLVEVDALILDELVKKRVIQPWRQPPFLADWLPQARVAATIGGQIFGVPHLLCGHFVIGRSSLLAGVRTFDELVSRIRSESVGKHGLVGNYVGSWNLPALYLDALSDVRPSVDLDRALADTLDPAAVRGLASAISLCARGGVNPCIDGTFDDDSKPDSAAQLFASGGAVALFGYSERLNPVLLVNPKLRDSLSILSLPLAATSTPTLFTDVLVLGSSVDVPTRKAASAFAGFLISTQVQTALLTTADGPQGAPPRYLLPSTKSSLAALASSGDPLYAELSQQLGGARPYPSSGFPGSRKRLAAALMERLGISQ